MGLALTDVDEGLHRPGDQPNWNESRYVDFWDTSRRVGGWFRIGARPNSGYAEMSACLFLPDGRTAFAFDRAAIEGNGLGAGGQLWEISEPWYASTVRFDGAMTLLDDPWSLTNPKRAFSENPTAAATACFEVSTEGLSTVMGQDQDQHHLIFLPGQADFHHQHMARVRGTATVGEECFSFDGRGGKDHSWGPRNWHAKRYLRWLTCCIDDRNGFMLTRSVGPTAQRRSGFVVIDGNFRIVDGFDMTNRYAGPPWYQLESTEVVVRSGSTTVSAVGRPQGWLPLRHVQPSADGEPAVLRIVKQPATWDLPDGSVVPGHLEYHDLMVDGVPVGLHE